MQEQIDSFNINIVQAIREGNMEKLRQMHKKRKTLQYCKRFGESVNHMACYHGLTDVVKFLIEEIGSTLRVRDDYGRTPFYDAFWTGELKEPEVLLMSNNRGHSP